jgi:hypothetical protein
MEEKNTVVKMKGKEMQEVGKFFYFENMVWKYGKNQNERN